ncbi:hypothetical protein ACQF36_25620 [Streptomyces sp. Marseille-Q5077]|uniref:hypothetical protein n=1 Tax=unclassified Streptomyces TaxID=2593676 RepID=UPI0036AD3C49
MRIRTALAATALGTLVVFGGAAAAHADVDDQSSFGVGSQENQGWQEPTFNDQGGAAFGSEGSQAQDQGAGFGDAEGAEGSFLQ